MRRTRAILFNAVLVLGAGRAYADPPEQRDTIPQSVLPNILVTSPGPGLELRFDTVVMDEMSPGEVLALELRAQHLGKNGVGGYAKLPAVVARDDHPYIGNFEIGGLLVNHSPGGLDSYARAGVALSARDQGTMENGPDDSWVVPMMSLAARPLEALPMGFGSWGRSAVGVRARSGSFVYGTELHLDVPFSTQGVSLLVGLAASIGIADPRGGVATGLTVLGSPGEDGVVMGLSFVADKSLGSSARVYAALGMAGPDVFDERSYSIGVGLRHSL